MFAYLSSLNIPVDIRNNQVLWRCSSKQRPDRNTWRLCCCGLRTESNNNYNDTYFNCILKVSALTVNCCPSRQSLIKLNCTKI